MASKGPKLKYIIFDIDGTLTDTTEVDDECYMNSFETMFGVSIKNVKWSNLKNVTDWGISEELIELKLKRKSRPGELKNLKDLFLQNLKSEFAKNKSKFREIIGASAFYALLSKNKEYKIGIATGGWEETANFKLEAIGINPTSVIYSNSNYFRERERITMDVIKQLNVLSASQPEEVIYFGDGVWDFRTCQKLGIRFVGIDSSANNKLRSLGVTEVFSDFSNPEIIMNTLIASSR